jgi:RNA polymerase sigma-70 factor (ECF subfamily)
MTAMSSPPPFWLLVESHGPALHAYARRLVGRDDAEDVLQDALLRALRAYDRLAHADNLKGWLFQITTRAAYDHHDRRKRRPEIPAGDDLPDVPTTTPSPDGFDDLVGSLSEDARVALRLRYEDDLPYDAIAERLGCSPAAARQRVSTAVRTLRRSLT